MAFNTIPIIFVSDENYMLYTVVCMCSILENIQTTKKIEFILLEDGVSEKSREELRELISRYENASVRFINCDYLFENKNMFVRAHFSRAMYLRLYIPNILKEYDKVLYTDQDVIFKSNLSELYNLDLKGKMLGACKAYSIIDRIEKNKKGFNHMKYKDYIGSLYPIKYYENHFYSGLLLMDLKQMREKNILEKLINLADSDTPKDLPDMDILNSVLINDVTHIHPKWNYCHFFDDKKRRKLKRKHKELDIEEKDLLGIHYASSDKPWKNPKTNLSKYYFEYLSKVNKINKVDDLSKSMINNLFKLFKRSS